MSRIKKFSKKIKKMLILDLARRLLGVGMEVGYPLVNKAITNFGLFYPDLVGRDL